LPSVNVTGARHSGTNMTELHSAMLGGAKGLQAPDISASIARAAAQAKWITERDQAKGFLGQQALGMVANNAGPFGNAISGLGSAVMTGNPYMIAAAGVTGLIDGLVGLGEESRRAREAFRQWQNQFASFMDSLRVEAGEMSSSEAGINAFKRANEEQRRFLELQLALATGNDIMKKLAQMSAADARKALEDLNRLEGDIIEKRRKEADQLERINAAYRNAPRGFSVSGYSVASTGRADRPGGRGFDTSNATFVLQAGAIQVNGNRSGAEMVRELIQELDALAQARGSAGGSRSQALELM
jgi:hypothetical protein